MDGDTEQNQPEIRQRRDHQDEGHYTHARTDDVQVHHDVQTLVGHRDREETARAGAREESAHHCGEYCVDQKGIIFCSCSSFSCSSFCPGPVFSKLKFLLYIEPF